MPKDLKLLKYFYAVDVEPYLHIMITHECNFSCRYCLAHIAMDHAKAKLKRLGRKGAKEWTEDFRKGVLRLIDGYPGDEVLFTGGEPLLTTKLNEYPYLGDYIKHAADTDNKKRKIRVITNAFAIQNRKAGAMKFF